MRISDWSSDVCSSDLAALALHLRQKLAVGQAVDGKLGPPRAAVVLAGRERNAGGAGSFEVDRHRIIGTHVILLQFGVVWTSCASISALICSATSGDANGPSIIPSGMRLGSGIGQPKIGRASGRERVCT